MAMRCPVTDKVSYGTVERAQKALEYRRKSSKIHRNKMRRVTTRFYKCPHCQNYHMTSKPKRY